MANDRKAANLWTARVIPVLLLGIFGYATFVLTKEVCVDYLISPPSDIPRSPQRGAAAAILVIYYLLLIPVLGTFGRLIQTVVTNPGYVPRGPQWHQRQLEKAESVTEGRTHGRRRGHTPLKEKTGGQSPPQDGESASFEHSSLESQDMKDGESSETFWHKDIFVCNYDGRPAWCSTCLNFKPERAHHCSEVNRCVRKMDHFCPWVGGIVGENHFKFFTQFVSWAALYCLHVLVVTAIYISDRYHKSGTYNVNWVVLLAIAGLFFLFTAGMSGSSLQFILTNSTTVENLTRKTKIWYLAVLIPRPADGGPPTIPFYRNNNANAFEPPNIRTITYPRPPEEQQILEAHNGSMPTTSSAPPSAQHSPTQPSSATQTWTSPPRTFAILETRPGETPFDLGVYRNFQQVMGFKPLDWILPFKRSPCTDHSSGVSAFPMGQVVERLKREAGFIEDERAGEPTGKEVEKVQHNHHHSHRRRRHRNGEAVVDGVSRSTHRRRSGSGRTSSMREGERRRRRSTCDGVLR